jgi:hypothetical protein
MSDRTVAAKLLIKPEAAVWASDPARSDLVGVLPDGARWVNEIEDATVAVVFADDAATLRGIVARDATRLGLVPVLWVVYPKGNRTDLNRDSLWPILAAHGLRPITQVAVDDVWSALRFRPLKPGEPPFSGGG